MCIILSMLEYNITCINVVRCHKISANYLSIETYLCIFFNSILHCVFVFLFFVFTPPWNCGGAIFLLQFVCVCVCLSVRLRTKWGSNRYQTCLVLRISVAWLRFWVQTTHATFRKKICIFGVQKLSEYRWIGRQVFWCYFTYRLYTWYGTNQ